MPTIQALSPNSSKQGGPAFTLSVVGSNFVPASTIRWNGSSRPTGFFSSNLVTANIPASLLSASGAPNITVVNRGPSYGDALAAMLQMP